MVDLEKLYDDFNGQWQRTIGIEHEQRYAARRRRGGRSNLQGL
jgi:hypothetical protein